VREVEFPAGFYLERLRREHPRRLFRCGQEKVDDWLATKALQNQEKQLSATRALLDANGAIAGYYTLAMGQVDCSDLPSEMVKHLPRRLLPVAVLAWLGVSQAHQGQGLGDRLLAQALRDCYEAGKTFAFIAVVIDCIDDAAKAFYQRWDFKEMPGHPYRLLLRANELEALMQKP
jgi:GNAT superfamily N-acetyltransferase